MRLLCFLLLMVLSLPAHAGHKPPQVLMSIFVQTTGNGMSYMQSRTIAIPPNNEEIQIRALPEVTQENLIALEPDPSGGVRLTFDHVGQVNIDAATAQNQGRILVVTIDGYVVYAPNIDEEITNGQLVIPHPLPADIVSYLKEKATQNAAKYKKL